MKDVIFSKIDEKSLKLAALIAQDLATFSSQEKKVCSNVKLMKRLDAVSWAQDAYLDARHNTIEAMVGKVDQQSLSFIDYIETITVVTFTLIQHTYRIYSMAFTDPKLMSSVVAWGTRQVQGNLAILTIVAFLLFFSNREENATEETTLDAEAIVLAHSQSLKILGFDIEFLWQDLVNAANSNSTRTDKVIRSVQ